MYLLVAGVLKGFDHLLNIVLDNCTEFMRGLSICILGEGMQ